MSSTGMSVLAPAASAVQAQPSINQVCNGQLVFLKPSSFAMPSTVLIGFLKASRTSSQTSQQLCKVPIEVACGRVGFELHWPELM